MEIIDVNEDKCVGCNSCVRVCPVQDANVAKYINDNNGNKKLIIQIDSDRCIRCGACISACSHSARYYNDDTDRFIKDLKRGEKIIVIAPPAIKIAFDGMWRHVLQWLRDNGIESVYDVSFGADICTWSYIKYLEEHKGKKIISQPCPAIVNYCLKIKNELLQFLAPIQSPMLCLAIYIRKYLLKNYKIAALSPCIAKKEEFIQTNNIIEYNITFQNLKKYFKDNNISLPNVKSYSNFEFDDTQGIMGSIYSKPSGLKENILKRMPDAHVIGFEGVSKVYNGLNDYLTENYSALPDVFDVLSCEFGCNSGPAISQNYKQFKMEDIMHDVDKYVNEKMELNIDEDGNDKQFKEFDEKLNLNDFIREYKPYGNTVKKISTSEVNAAFGQLLKVTDEERNFDCHACGFSTCYDMACAIARGINVPDNCYQFIMKKMAEERTVVENINESVLEIIKQLNDIFIKLNKNIESVKLESEVINNLGQTGYKHMNLINEYMGQLMEVSSQMLERVGDINKEAINYKKVTDSVEEIADNINLLSFNASIEAARAGESGRGFSVIANSIRELSSNSKKSVNDANIHNQSIRLTITDIKSSISEFNDRIEKLMDLVKSTMKDVHDTSENSKLINDSMNNVKSLSNEVYALIEKTNETLAK